MEEPKKESVVRKFPGKEADPDGGGWDIPEKRLRFVDFQRIEDNRYDEELSRYELEVKAKLASVPSPSDLMIREEEEKEEERKERKRMNRLAGLVERANLTPRQRACFEILYVERLAEEKVRERLGIPQRRLCELKGQIERALKTAEQRRLAMAQMRGNAGWRNLTVGQKEVLRLRYRSNLSLERIAQRLGVRKQTVDEVLGTAQKNFKKFQGTP